MSASSEQRFLDTQGRLTQWPSKHADKLLVLAYLASKFEFGRRYPESEVNTLLKTWHTFDDWPLLRRELFEQGFVDRDKDGSNYRLKEISTGLDGLTLVKPEVERDARAGVKWLAGPGGAETLKLMGNTETEIKPATLQEERARVRGFLSSTDRHTWMIRSGDNIVGAVWVDIEPTEYLPAPAVHIMIGDPAARGHGIGENVILSVIAQLGSGNRLYSRHLIDNVPVTRLLAKVGFENEGRPYQDSNGLNWQNVVRDLAKP